MNCLVDGVHSAEIISDCSVERSLVTLRFPGRQEEMQSLMALFIAFTHSSICVCEALYPDQDGISTRCMEILWAGIV
jgi:hypothetical protein